MTAPATLDETSGQPRKRFAASASVASARGRIGVATHRGDAAAIAAARRDLKAAKAEDYIRRLVEEAPPLTDEQLDRLAALLRPVLGSSTVDDDA